ncbi:hypothetical protein AB9K34_11330 [Sedimentitalea sp. XS_ASV28]|uniref:hypothetical protein n=1 Tax=Sedimentitalea sp. XS_ASV28 TaxID=3241296 RepID=UPI0035167CB1
MLLPALLLVGCAQVPQLDETISDDLENADYPALAPIETLLVPLPDPQERSKDVQQDLQGRLANLQDRARRLNDRPVVDEETRTRMQAGVQE